MKLLKQFILLVIIVFGLSSCTQDGTNVPQQKTPAYFSNGTWRPYRIKDKCYYPQTHYEYEAQGTASWYGAELHGRRTSGGHVFNMHEFTAAHRTLPIPCLARVTNLDNGKSIIVLVNDRGPFSRDKNRIVDVSKSAASALGFTRLGTANVRVQSLVPETLDYIKNRTPVKKKSA